MESAGATHDAIIVGGGFYGAAIALYLIRARGLQRVVLLEQEDALLQRASYTNQARVHNGYHYPRSFTTAYRSRVNLPQFVHDYPEAVRTDFIKLYAIARQNSKVTARQFERFCREIGAFIEPASPVQRALFEPRLVEDVFVVQEYAFDTTALARRASRELAEAGVDTRLGTRATGVVRGIDGRLVVETLDRTGAAEVLQGRLVFNCTYSGLNQLHGALAGVRTRLKHEITEMALMDMPPPLCEIGITVMDGPFFSLMPFPARGLHTLSHVRYTPHLHWADSPELNPYAKLHAYAREPRVDRMVRDVARYIPQAVQARYVESLFEVKTILVKNEGDDGRPILFEKAAGLPGYYSILGGKIDNIYDVLQKLDEETLAHA